MILELQLKMRQMIWI